MEKVTDIRLMKVNNSAEFILNWKYLYKFIVHFICKMHVSNSVQLKGLKNNPIVMRVSAFI